MRLGFKTLRGKAYIGDSLKLLGLLEDGSVNLARPLPCKGKKSTATPNSMNTLNG